MILIMSGSADPIFNSQMGELDAAAASLGIQVPLYLGLVYLIPAFRRPSKYVCI